MSIVLIGANHKTAPVELRERLALSEEATVACMRALVDGEGIREAFVLSTCNRVEILVVTGAQSSAETTQQVRNFLSKTQGVPLPSIRSHTYVHVDDEAVDHLFRVAASLDSMVIGEPQILGQVRKAFSLAMESGTCGPVLNKLLPNALHAAKRARHETDIATSAVSISYMAVELGRKIFESLAGRTVLLIGAGETAELSARNLVKAGVKRVLIANRTQSKAEQLAQRLSGEVVDFTFLGPALADSDIVICSTGCPRYLITPEVVKSARTLGPDHPTVYIDLSVPRNIDPAVSEAGDVFLFDIDDLEAVIQSNIHERVRETERASEIINEEVERFHDNLRAQEIGRTIGAVRERMQHIARMQLLQQRNRLGSLTSEQEKAIETLLIATVNKVAHPVISRLRASIESGLHENLQVWREMFELDGQLAEP